MNKISIKTKTIMLVFSTYILLSVIFLFIRYMDIQNFSLISQKKEQNQMKLIYYETLKSISNFYFARARANLKSFGIEKAFINEDKESLYKLSKPRWNVISSENKYLSSFRFYSKDGNVLTYFGIKPREKLKYFNKYKTSYNGFWVDNNKFNYHNVSIVYTTPICQDNFL